MKKYFPILIFIMIFSGFLGSQILIDYLSARPSSDQKKLYSHYQNAFRETSFKTMGGRVIRLSEVKAPIVIINFWASWCLPCLIEFPSLVELKEKFSDDEIFVVGINGDEDGSILKVQQIKDKFNINFPLVHDSKGTILNEYLVSSIPFSIIFHKGKVIEVNRGAKDFYSDEVLNMLTKHIKMKNRHDEVSYQRATNFMFHFKTILAFLFTF